MSATTSSNDGIEGDSIREQFEEEMVIGATSEEGVSISNRPDTVVLILDWEEFQSDMTFNREDFSENPTGVTRHLLGHGDRATYVFSSGDNRAHYDKNYVESVSAIIGYDLKANLNDVYLMEEEDGLLVAEGDDFDMMIAPRTFPE